MASCNQRVSGNEDYRKWKFGEVSDSVHEDTTKKVKSENLPNLKHSLDIMGTAVHLGIQAAEVEECCYCCTEKALPYVLGADCVAATGIAAGVLVAANNSYEADRTE